MASALFEGGNAGGLKVGFAQRTGRVLIQRTSLVAVRLKLCSAPLGLPVVFVCVRSHNSSFVTVSQNSPRGSEVAVMLRTSETAG